MEEEERGGATRAKAEARYDAFNTPFTRATTSCDVQLNGL